MKSFGLWLSFVAAITLSGGVNAEYVDDLPPIPYQLSPLIKGAMINLTLTQFSNTLGSDKNEITAALLQKRGGKEGQTLWDATKKCDDKTIPMTDERKTRCVEIAIDGYRAVQTILFRDYGRAVFKLAGYSLDKSLVAFANDCNTLGSCEIVMQKILELTNSMESKPMFTLFGGLCVANNSDIRKRFLPSNVTTACTKMFSSAPFKEEICKLMARERSECSDNAFSKTKYCTKTGYQHYPEIDCN